MCDNITERQKATAKRHQLVFESYFELRKKVRNEMPLEYQFLPDSYYATKLSEQKDIGYTPQTISKIISKMIKLR